VEPFTGGMRVDETPRFRKGRDSAAWVGLGEHTEVGAGTNSQDAARTQLRSAWGTQSVLGSLKAAGLTAGSLQNLANIPALPKPIAQPVTLDGRNYDCDTRLAPPKKTSAAVPKTFKYETPRRTRAQSTAGRYVKPTLYRGE
jgi:hypothetical protein